MGKEDTEWTKVIGDFLVVQLRDGFREVITFSSFTTPIYYLHLNTC